MGFPAGWTEPCYPLNIPGQPFRMGGDTTVSHSKRMGLLGIAVAVPQSRWIGERLMDPYQVLEPQTLNPKPLTLNSKPKNP
jgi:hypothetical protein